MTLSNRRMMSTILSALISLTLISSSLAQVATVCETTHEYNYDSGRRRNALTTVSFSDAGTIQLDLTQTKLAPGAKLILTGTRKGSYQELNDQSLRVLNGWSDAIDGNQVEVQLIGPTGSGNKKSRVVISGFKTDTCFSGDGITSESICGDFDDRIASEDVRAGRIGGCTGWLISEDVFIQAGHCGTPSSSTRIHFTYGVSNAPVQDQYAVDVSSYVGVNGGVGNDWGVGRLLPNSSTGKLPGVAQSEKCGSPGCGWYTLGTVPSSTSGNNIRVTGYGTAAVDSRSQKTHVGPLTSMTTTALRYRPDTTGGNSGSPVIHEETGHAIGVHTHGGCSATGGSNAGTRIDRAEFAAAVDALLSGVSPTPAPTPACQQSVFQLNLLTDNYPGETTWTLTNNCSGGQVASGGPYGSSGTAYTETACVPEGEYTFTINDSYGDGICCGYGSGSYSIEYEGSTVVPNGGQFSSTISHTFGSCGNTPTNPPTNPPTSPPTLMPTIPPTNSPTNPPTNSPTNLPTNLPTNPPTNSPTNLPTNVPTLMPTIPPTFAPTPVPTPIPTPVPTPAPTLAPTLVPTPFPTPVPTPFPTPVPTPAPSPPPITVPTTPPTSPPITVPTPTPTPAPTTSAPTPAPTNAPIPDPTSTPTPAPTPTPTSAPVPDNTCVDEPLGWYDIDGPYYNCEWYAQSNYCEMYGNSYANNGVTANMACCACGGGRGTAPTPAPLPCNDSPAGWYDIDGPVYDCEWYSQFNYCEIYGDSYENNGATANQACCACGGGDNPSLSVAGGAELSISSYQQLSLTTFDEPTPRWIARAQSSYLTQRRGNWMARIKKNKSLTLKDLDVPSECATIRVEFSYFTVGFEEGDKFKVEAKYTKVDKFVNEGEFVFGEDFENTDNRAFDQEVIVEFPTYGQSQLTIQISNDSNEGNDRLFLDDIKVECGVTDTSSITEKPKKPKRTMRV